MQITNKEQNGLSYSFAVTVAAADIDRQVEQELASLGKKVKIPGFRPGKIPLSVLRQRYMKDVMGDVLQNAINKASREVLEQNKLRPAMQPDIKITDFEEGKDLQFAMSLDVMPELPKIAYDKIEVPEFTYDVPAEELEQGLKRLAQSRTHLHTKDGAAELGDVVKIDFLGKREGKPFSGGAAKGFSLDLGSGQFIPGFEEQLVGVKAGDERVVEVTFPKEYHSADLAGQPATFDITVHEVSYKHTPDADDKLAENLGFKNLQELSEAVSKQIDADYARAARNRSKKFLFDAMDENIKFDVPKRMLDLEFESVWKQVDEAKKAGDASLKDKSDADLKAEYQKISERRVRLGILLSEIGRENGIQITREELSSAVMQQARMYPGQEEKIFEFYRKNPNQIDELRGPILEEKAVDFLLGKVKRTPKKISVEELLREDEDDATGSAEAEKPKKKASKKKEAE
jgi:trigger factor